MEQHHLFANPRVIDIANLLIEKSRSQVSLKSKEELITEAYIVVKKGFVKILALEEEEEGGVDGNTDLFDKGGGQFVCYCCCCI